MNRGEMVAAFRRRLADRSYCDADVVSFLNEALLEVASRRSWTWLRKTYMWRLTGAATVTGCSTTEDSPLLTSTSTFPGTMVGRRVIVGDTVYAVKSQFTTSIVVLDSAAPAAWSGSAVVLYDDVALPRGATGVVSSVDLDGSTAPLPLRAVSSREIVQRDSSIQGPPSEFAVVEARRHLQPAIAPPTPVTAGTAVGTGPRVGTGLAAPKFRYWYSFVDRQSGWESALSPYVEVTIDDDEPWEFTLNRGMPQSSTAIHVPAGFHVRIYRSKANGKVPHLLDLESESFEADPNSSTFPVSDNVKDAWLGPPVETTATSWQLRLFPVPDDSSRVEVVYQSAPQPMSADNDSPPFGAQYHPALVDLAVACALESAGEQGRADQKRENAERVFRRMELADRPNRDLVRAVGAGRAGRNLSSYYPTALDG